MFDTLLATDLGSLGNQLTQARALLGIGLVIILVYWTGERAAGEADDPSIRYSMSSETGTASALVSGAKAVAIVAGAAFVLLFGVVEGATAVVGAVLGAIVIMHWIAEKQEAEGDSTAVIGDDD